MLPEAIELIVVTPERQLLRETVVEVTIPGLDGALGILPGHAPLMTELGDLSRAEAAKARAEKRLASNDTNIDWDRATVALERAVIRIQVARKYRGQPVEIPHPA